MLAYNDNVCWHATTMYAGLQRQCMLACNDTASRHTVKKQRGTHRCIPLTPLIFNL
ncbi:MAG: hypothetical protein LBS54_02435 [Dysgonamonadaceae bacterium]|nr:hypothetical protein [Dysgonamonadaceae bacterium]